MGNLLSKRNGSAPQSATPEDQSQSNKPFSRSGSPTVGKPTRTVAQRLLATRSSYNGVGLAQHVSQSTNLSPQGSATKHSNQYLDPYPEHRFTFNTLPTGCGQQAYYSQPVYITFPSMSPFSQFQARADSDFALSGHIPKNPITVGGFQEMTSVEMLSKLTFSSTWVKMLA